VELFRLKLCFALGLNRRKIVARHPVQTAFGEIFWWDEEIWVLSVLVGSVESSSSGGNFRIVLYLDAFPHP